MDDTAVIPPIVTGYGRSRGRDLPEAQGVVETAREFLNVAEVAEVLGLRPVTIYRWCRAGRLASVKIGKEWRIRRTALDDLLGRSLRDELGHRDDGGGPMHEVPLEIQELARRLLRQETGERREPTALATAVERACARLRGRLVPLIGRTGFTALFRRALRLAQGEFPALAALTVEEGAEPCIGGAREFAAAHADDPGLVEAALVAILTHFTGLLSTFVGEALTLRVIDEGWPARADETETAT